MITLAQLAQKLGVSENTVRNWDKSGAIEVQIEVRNGKPVRVVSDYEVNRLLTSKKSKRTAEVNSDEPQYGPQETAVTVEYQRDAAVFESQRLEISQLKEQNEKLIYEKGVLQGRLDETATLTSTLTSRLNELESKQDAREDTLVENLKIALEELRQARAELSAAREKPRVRWPWSKK